MLAIVVTILAAIHISPLFHIDKSLPEGPPKVQILSMGRNRANT